MDTLESRQAKKDQVASTLRAAACRKQTQEDCAEWVIRQAITAWDFFRQEMVDDPPTPFQCDVLRGFLAEGPPSWDTRSFGLKDKDYHVLEAWLA